MFTGLPYGDTSVCAVFHSALARHSVIASGYLFTALLIVPYLSPFGRLAPNGLMGNLQTMAHAYPVWHWSFPLFVSRNR